MYDFDWSSIPGALPFLWEGMKVSLEITLSAVIFGIVWGTALAMMRLSPVKPLAMFAAGYVNLFRAIPLVMVLLWFFLIVPQVLRGAFNLDPNTDVRLTSAMIGFALFESAYYSEIIRAGIQSVPKGQVSAASALGMTYAQAMRRWCCPRPSATWFRCSSPRPSCSSRTPPWSMSRPSPTSLAPPTRWATGTGAWWSCCSLPAWSISSSASRPPSWCAATKRNSTPTWRTDPRSPT